MGVGLRLLRWAVCLNCYSLQLSMILINSNIIFQCFEQKLKDMKGMKDTDVCTVYINRCVELCWIMCIQSPPVFLDVDRRYTEFDKDCLKSYTKSGEQVRYLVWPPLYIEKGGGLLMKGVAQGK